MVETLPDRARKGRGAVSNPTGRYEPYATVAVDDGWRTAAEDEDAPGPRTTVGTDASRSAMTRNRSPDIGFDRSVNPYRGCEHGCVYCFARPTHAWLGLSPGLDFETKLFAKPEAPRLLEAELARPGYEPATLALGTNTDPYQPIERRLGITRGLLEVLWRARHPVAIITKSQLVMRDLDILAPMARERLVRVILSVTTLDPTLARKMEPRAAAPARRLAALRALSEAGVPAGVLAAPMIPALNDDELEAILEAAAQAGARSAGYVLLRLPLEIKHLFLEWLDAHFPARKERVLALMRDARGGRLYDPTWGTRMRGTGAYAQLLEHRFKLARKRLGLDRHDFELDASRFQRPTVPGEQLRLL